MRAAHLTVLIAAALAGCGTTIYTLRVPLDERAPSSITRAPGVEITDLRPHPERVTHTGKTFSCQRWYGDETFVPSKLEYLKQLLSERLAPGETLQVSVERFDVIESCEDTASKAGAAAATGAGYGAGSPTVYVPSGVPGGDNVVVRVAGTFDEAHAFDVSRRFVYSDIRWKFTEMPAETPQYRDRLRHALSEIADEIREKARAH